MLFEKTEVWGFEHALRGMRNPKNSWDRSDSHYENLGYSLEDNEEVKSNNFYHIGEKDMELCKTLIKAGSEHRKFLRQIFISVDITAPFYWWKELDTYKIGTVANSCSTMHTLAKKPITMDCFEMDDFEDFDMDIGGLWGLYLIPKLEQLRLKYLKTKDKRYWKEMEDFYRLGRRTSLYRRIFWRLNPYDRIGGKQMIFCIILISLSLVGIIYSIKSKDTDGLIILFSVVLLMAMVGIFFIASVHAIETKNQIKDIRENPARYTVMDKRDVNETIKHIKRFQGSIFSFYNGFDTTYLEEI